MSYAVTRGYDSTKLAPISVGGVPARMESPCPFAHGASEVIGTPYNATISGGATSATLTAGDPASGGYVSFGTVDIRLITPRAARQMHLALSTSASGDPLVFGAVVTAYRGAKAEWYKNLYGGTSGTPVLSADDLSPYYRIKLRVEMSIAGDFAANDTVDLAISFEEE